MITSSTSAGVMSGTSAVDAFTIGRPWWSKLAMRKASCGSILPTMTESRGSAASTSVVTASSRSNSNEQSK